MNDDRAPIEEPDADQMAALGSVLARAELWDDLPAGLEDAVVAAIMGDVATDAAHAPAIALADRRPARTIGVAMPWWLLASAAVAILALAFAVALRNARTDDGVEATLAGAGPSAAASADVRLESTAAGLKILLTASGLDPAPDGYFYEAWVSDGQRRVSAGSFHLRWGTGTIELWAGVADPSFRLLTVTLEPIDGDTDSSGDVRLTGEYDLALED